MKKLMISLSTLFLLASVSLSVYASDDFVKQCKEYAKEEGVEGADLELYIQECVDSMKADAENQEEKKED